MDIDIRQMASSELRNISKKSILYILDLKKGEGLFHSMLP